MKRDLPKGVYIDRGYVFVRFMHKGVTYMKGFGPAEQEAVDWASIHAAEQYKKIKEGKWGKEPEIPRKRFFEAYKIFIHHWGTETDPSGRLVHGPEAVYKFKKEAEKHLLPAFGSLWFDDIKAKQVQTWRDGLVKGGLKGTGANRPQQRLSSIFSKIKDLIELEKIEAFRVPSVNPCEPVKLAQVEKRARLLTWYEAQKLKNAFINSCQDPDGWEICKLALKSVLSLKDLKKLELGQIIDLKRAKTGAAVHIPITVLVQLDWTNWRKRWEAARAAAGLYSQDPALNLWFMDLRKAGINWLNGQFDTKLIGQFAGHKSVKTTEGSYLLTEQEKMRPLAEYLKNKVDSL